jgi:hypothetical protein
VAVKLHRPGYEHAVSLVAEGKFVFDERDDWSEHIEQAAHRLHEKMGAASPSRAR